VRCFGKYEDLTGSIYQAAKFAMLQAMVPPKYKEESRRSMIMRGGGVVMDPCTPSKAFRRKKRKRTESNVAEGTQYAQHHSGISVGAHLLKEVAPSISLSGG